MYYKCKKQVHVNYRCINLIAVYDVPLNSAESHYFRLISAQVLRFICQGKTTVIRDTYSTFQKRFQVLFTLLSYKSINMLYLHQRHMFVE